METELNLLHQLICPALANPKRMQILYLLQDGPQPVGWITETMGIPQSSVSRHLAVLRERGIVNTEKQGTSVIYTLSDPRIIEAINILREVLRRQLDVHIELAQNIKVQPNPKLSTKKTNKNKS
jgi:DNA-binding transcriptional ArsR family regulator